MFRGGNLIIERLLFNLSALADLGAEVTSPKDFQRVVRSSLYLIMGTFAVSKGGIFGYDPSKKEFYLMASKGLEEVRDVRLRPAKGAIGQMVGINRPIPLNGIKQMGLFPGGDLKRVKAILIIPIVAGGELLGVITLGERLSGEGYTKGDYNILSMMAHHIALSIHTHTLLHRLNQKIEESKRLYENLGRIYYDTIHAFAAAIDAKDTYTKGHSHRVSDYCAAMAKELGWSQEDIEGIRVAGLLHDIGKIAVERSIINKSTPLTDEETRDFRRHPVIGYEILSRARFPWEGILGMVRNHHEKVDGSGYPDGLKRGNIPEGARIMALADAFDAMTTERPYRKRFSLEEALIEVNKYLDKQFDAKIATSLFSILQRELRGETDSPTILPYLHDPVDTRKVSRLLERVTKGTPI